MVHEIPVSEILENRLMIRLGIVHFIVDDAFLRPRSVQARSHGIIRRRGVTRSIAEVIIASEIVHPRGFEKVLDLDIFGRACKLNHIFLELHAAARIPRAPIHPDIVAIVENGGVNVQFHVIRRIVGDKRLPNCVFPWSGRMVRNGNANRKAFAPIFLDGSVMDRHIPVKFAISVFTVARKSARIRPFERLDAQNRPVIVIMFHIVGHEHVPVVHDESFIVIALRPLLVMPRKNKKRVVMHEGCGIRRIKVRRQRISCQSRLRTKSAK